MYAINIKNKEISFLSNAVYILNLKGYSLRSLDMDDYGACSITYYGHLSEQDIKEVMIHFFYPYENKSHNDIHPERYVDYDYNDTDDCEGKEFTHFWTPIGLDYRTLKV